MSKHSFSFKDYIKQLDIKVSGSKSRLIVQSHVTASINIYEPCYLKKNLLEDHLSIPMNFYFIPPMINSNIKHVKLNQNRNFLFHSKQILFKFFCAFLICFLLVYYIFKSCFLYRNTFFQILIFLMKFFQHIKLFQTNL